MKSDRRDERRKRRKKSGKFSHDDAIEKRLVRDRRDSNDRRRYKRKPKPDYAWNTPWYIKYRLELISLAIVIVCIFIAFFALGFAKK